MGQKLFVVAVKKEFNENEKSVVAWASKPLVDRDQEMINADAWKLDMFKMNPVLMLAHDYKQPPVGKVMWIKATSEGLKFKARFANSQIGEELFSLYKDGIMNAFSVGYAPKKWQDNPAVTDIKGIRPKKLFTEVDLVEISCVSIPALPEALVEAQKSGKLFTKSLNELVTACQAVVVDPSVSPPLPVGDPAEGESVGDDSTAVEEKTFEVMEELITEIETKVLDHEGNMSVFDIMSLLSLVIPVSSPEQMSYIRDIYPTNYPNGRIVVATMEGNEVELIAYDYTIENGVATLGPPLPVDEAYTLSSDDVQQSAMNRVFGKEKKNLEELVVTLKKDLELALEVKENRMLSKKNTDLITACCDSLASAHAMLLDLLKVAQESIKPKPEEGKSLSIGEDFLVLDPSPPPKDIVFDMKSFEKKDSNDLDLGVIAVLAKSAFEKIQVDVKTLVDEAIRKAKGRVC